MKKQECGMSGDGVRQNDGGLKRRHLLLTSLVAASALLGAGVAIPAQAQQPASTPPNGKPPNILVIMTDDVGIWNISAYHRGMMGGRTPNIDRIAKEGALFTDYYAQQSCTAGTSRVYSWTDAVPYRSAEGRPARRQAGPAGHRPDDRSAPQASWATQRRRSARTISVTVTNTFPRCTASTSSTASSITSTPWKSRMNPITRRAPSSWRGLAHAIS